MRNRNAVSGRGLAIGFAIFAAGAQAQSYHRNMMQDIRWLGRGNTGVATINDGTALFYNPAGLGMQDSYSFSLINPMLGANQNVYTNFSDFARFTASDSTLSDKMAPFLGNAIGIPLSFFPHVSVPNFAIGYWNYLEAQMLYSNPVNPELQVDYRNDNGVILGTGFGYKEIFSFGVSLKYTRRTIVQETFTATPSGLSLVQGAISDYSSLYRKGEGFGINVGAQSHFELGKLGWFAAGAAIEDLGFMKFKGTTTTYKPNQQAQQVSTGVALGFNSLLMDITLLADYRDMLNTSEHVTKHLFAGAETSLPGFDLRAGLYQGYWTAGATIRFLPLFDIDFATYGQEVFYAAGIKENRIWMVGLRSGIGFKAGKRGGKQKSKKKYRSQLDAL